MIESLKATTQELLFTASQNGLAAVDDRPNYC